MFLLMNLSMATETKNRVTRYVSSIIILGLVLFGFTSCISKDNSLANAPSLQSEDQVEVTPTDEPLILGLSENPSNLDGLNDRLPPYLTFVKPRPKSTLNQKEYNSYALSTGWDASKPGICLGFRPIDLVVEGEFPSQEELIDWISIDVGELLNLSVDGSLIHDSSEIITYPVDEEGEVDFDGEPIAIVPWGSPYGLCYAAALGPGYHVVELTVKNGDQLKGEYSWSFQIIE